MVKGYKVFDPDWTCRGKQYTCPGLFEESVQLDICKRGMHFCKQAIDCFNYYEFDQENHVAEVIAHGTVVEDGDKCCTDKLEIVREIPWAELLEIVNTGKGCTGKDNTGDWNTGDWNTGNRNTGDGNKGSLCTGNFNIADRCCGDFCTEEQPLILFDKPCNMTRAEWDRSDAMDILRRVNFTPVRWVSDEDMTDAEKLEHQEYKTTGVYLKRIDTEPDFYESCWRKWWSKLPADEKRIILAIPNFDAEKFKKITGIEVRDDDCP